MNRAFKSTVLREARWRAIGAATVSLASGLALLGCSAKPQSNAVPADSAGAVTATLSAPAVMPSGAVTPTRATAPGMATAQSSALSPEDEQDMVALIRSLFSAAIRSSEPDMQDVVVVQMTTPELGALRGNSTPDASVIGYSAGYIWVVGFKTSAPLTLATFTTPENIRDLAGIGPSDSLAGPDGLTSLYYIVITQSPEGNRRFVPISQGILVPGKSSWSLDDLKKPTPIP